MNASFILQSASFHLHGWPDSLQEAYNFKVMDVPVQTNMEGAAKRDNHSKLWNSVNRQTVESKLFFRALPESMFASVLFCSFRRGGVTPVPCVCVFLAPRCSTNTLFEQDMEVKAMEARLFQCSISTNFQKRQIVVHHDVLALSRCKCKEAQHRMKHFACSSYCHVTEGGRHGC